MLASARCRARRTTSPSTAAARARWRREALLRRRQRHHRRAGQRMTEADPARPVVDADQVGALGRGEIGQHGVAGSRAQQRGARHDPRRRSGAGAAATRAAGPPPGRRTGRGPDDSPRSRTRGTGPPARSGPPSQRGGELQQGQRRCRAPRRRGAPPAPGSARGTGRAGAARPRPGRAARPRPRRSPSGRRTWRRRCGPRPAAPAGRPRCGGRRS